MKNDYSDSLFVKLKLRFGQPERTMIEAINASTTSFTNPNVQNKQTGTCVSPFLTSI